MDSEKLSQQIEFEISNLSDKAIQLLKDFKSIWTQLESEPNGTYPYQNHSIHFPPSPTKYWNLLKKVNQITTNLDNELDGKLNFGLFEFRHSLEKEGTEIRDFECKRGWPESKYSNKLSKLMINFNKRLHRELYTLFLWSEAIEKK